MKGKLGNTNFFNGPYVPFTKKLFFHSQYKILLILCWKSTFYFYGEGLGANNRSIFFLEVLNGKYGNYFLKHPVLT